MVAVDLTPHDVLVQLGKHLGGEDILSEDAVVLPLTILVAHT